MAESLGAYVFGKFDSEGKLEVSPYLRSGDEKTIVTHNFCDATTWWTESERVTSGAAVVVSGSDRKVWTLPHSNIIDVSHGKIFEEDSLVSNVSHDYSVNVYVGGVLKTERTPFAQSGGDYVMNYASGTITFASAIDSKNSVHVSYSYAGGSGWWMTPSSGTIINIEFAEAQFSKNIEMNDTLVTTVYGYAGIFAPEYVALGLLASGSLIPLQPDYYKTIANIIEEAMGAYPVIPAIGGSVRGIADEIYGFPFQYRAKKSLTSAYGLRLKISLQNNIAYGGELCSLTCYTTIEPIT